MKTIGSNGLKILKILHIISGMIWVGGAFCIILLLLTTISTDSHELYMRSLSIKLIDDWLIIPGANGIFATALIYGIWTKWGFFRHTWITVKWVLTAFMMLSGTFAMGYCVNENVYDVAEIMRYTPDNSEFWRNISQIMLWGMIQIILLMATIVISVFKPWKKTKI